MVDKKNSSSKNMKRSASTTSATIKNVDTASKKRKATATEVKDKSSKTSSKEENKEEEDASSTKKSGIMHQVNLKYAELTNTKKERNATMLIEQIIELIRSSKMPPIQVGCSPDGSRAFQACLKWGDRRHRDQILDFFENCIPDLCADEKGGALLQKMLRYCPKILTEGSRNNDGSIKKVPMAQLNLQKQIVERLILPIANLSDSSIKKLLFSKFGCKNLQLILNQEHIKASIKNKIYNIVCIPKKIRLMCSDYSEINNLNKFIEILIKKSTSKDEDDKSSQEALNYLKEMIEHMDDVIDKIVDKELLNQPITHTLLNIHSKLLFSIDNILNCDASKKKEDGDDTSQLLKNFVEKRLPIDACPHLLQSKCGVEAMCHYLGYFSAKQKKQFLKLLKGRMRDMAMNNTCYILLLRLLAVIDDTVLSNKSILQEFLEAPVVEIKTLNKDDDDDDEKTNEKEEEKSNDKDDKLSSLASLLKESIFARKVIYSILEEPSQRYYGPNDMKLCFDLPAPLALKDPSKRRTELKNFLIKPLLQAIDEIGWIESLKIKFLKDITLSFLSIEKVDENLEKIGKSNDIVKNFLDQFNLCIEKEQNKSLTELLSKSDDLSCSLKVLIVRRVGFANEFWTEVISKQDLTKVTEYAPWLIVDCFKHSSDKGSKVMNAMSEKGDAIKVAFQKAENTKPKKPFGCPAFKEIFVSILEKK